MSVIFNLNNICNKQFVLLFIFCCTLLSATLSQERRPPRRRPFNTRPGLSPHLRIGNYCPRAVSRMVSCRVPNGTESYQGKVKVGNEIKYMTMERPHYVDSFKEVKETEYGCCPGFQGDNCDDACYNCTLLNDLYSRVKTLELKLRSAASSDARPARTDGFIPSALPNTQFASSRPSGRKRIMMGPPDTSHVTNHPLNGGRRRRGRINGSGYGRRNGRRQRWMGVRRTTEGTPRSDIDIVVDGGNDAYDESATTPRPLFGNRCNCPAGPPAAPGPPGPPGLPGVSVTSSNGETVKLSAGLPGPPGPAGISGSVGYPGIPGSPGINSVIPGPVGPRGPAGTEGLDGLDGRHGDVGPMGPPGIGIAGKQGDPGLDGLPGKHGTDGLHGLPGRDGPKGSPGIPGLPGLQGTPGDKGEHGLGGPPGLPGIHGRQGLIGHPGHPGAVGLPGPSGISAGNYNRGGSEGSGFEPFLDGEDSYHSRPLKGEKGAKGDVGSRGGDGVKGDRGFDGVRGSSDGSGVEPKLMEQLLQTMDDLRKSLNLMDSRIRIIETELPRIMSYIGAEGPLRGSPDYPYGNNGVNLQPGAVTPDPDPELHHEDAFYDYDFNLPHGAATLPPAPEVNHEETLYDYDFDRYPIPDSDGYHHPVDTHHEGSGSHGTGTGTGVDTSRNNVDKWDLPLPDEHRNSIGEVTTEYSDRFDESIFPVYQTSPRTDGSFGSESTATPPVPRPPVEELDRRVIAQPPPEEGSVVGGTDHPVRGTHVDNEDERYEGSGNRFDGYDDRETYDEYNYEDYNYDYDANSYDDLSAKRAKRKLRNYSLTLGHNGEVSSIMNDSPMSRVTKQKNSTEEVKKLADNDKVLSVNETTQRAVKKNNNKTEVKMSNKVKDIVKSARKHKNLKNRLNKLAKDENVKKNVGGSRRSNRKYLKDKMRSSQRKDGKERSRRAVASGSEKDQEDEHFTWF